MMAILIPVKSGEKISFLIAIELGLVFIIATLDTNMVPAGRGFKARIDITIFSTRFERNPARNLARQRAKSFVVIFNSDESFRSFVGSF